MTEVLEPGTAGEGRDSVAVMDNGAIYSNSMVRHEVAGVIRDVSGSYGMSLGFCACCLLSSVLIGLLLPTIIAHQKTRTRKAQEQQNTGQQNMLNKENV
ncbi:hypothetical protein Pcinc_006917 [Petrolisthes cinctipes]|uniref:Uncharacterized protein n=1 Tax=Petrolisthes cinctipes TaxID=88211 RepID=A0AAE1KXG4_PETCI|nr:hypothetical protein Pcinc_006917 [Petrolisthes cinctipes]